MHLYTGFVQRGSSHLNLSIPLLSLPSEVGAILYVTNLCRSQNWDLYKCDCCNERIKDAFFFVFVLFTLDGSEVYSTTKVEVKI